MTADKVYRSELPPVDFLRRSGRVFPAKTAVVHGNRRYTYAQFAERASRLASGLLSAGFQTGDSGNRWVHPLPFWMPRWAQ